MLIARSCPIMRVIHLKGGQLGYGGHVVNVAQDITTFAATLPRLAADVPIIILRREGQEPGQHKDLHVRRVRVQRAFPLFDSKLSFCSLYIAVLMHARVSTGKYDKLAYSTTLSGKPPWDGETMSVEVP